MVVMRALDCDHAQPRTGHQIRSQASQVKKWNSSRFTPRSGFNGSGWSCWPWSRCSGPESPVCRFFWEMTSRCSLWLETDPWSVWTRWTVMQFVGFTGDDSPRAVFSFLVVRHKMLGIMAGKDQKDSYAVHPCHDAEAVSHGPDCSADLCVSTAALGQGGSCPCHAGRAGFPGHLHPCLGGRGFSTWSRPSCRPLRFFSCSWKRLSMPLSCRSCRFLGSSTFLS